MLSVYLIQISKHTTEALYSHDHQFIDEETNEIITFNILCDEHRTERIYIHSLPLNRAPEHPSHHPLTNNNCTCIYYSPSGTDSECGEPLGWKDSSSPFSGNAFHFSRPSRNTTFAVNLPDVLHLDFIVLLSYEDLQVFHGICVQLIESMVTIPTLSKRLVLLKCFQTPFTTKKAKDIRKSA